MFVVWIYFLSESNALTVLLIEMIGYLIYLSDKYIPNKTNAIERRTDARI